ncbi:hypothetical protein Y695_02148 [Hydrogenophaga sp. T4]|nr:hypothetical protein Y695_02148 [Hydrogenophaga sp. T4]
MRHHFELQLPHGAEQQHAARHRAEHLDCAFFTQLGQAGAQLLAAQRIGHFHAADDFRREEGQTGELQALTLRQGVAQLQHAVVRDADDVAGKRLVQQLAPLRQKAHHGVGPQVLAAAHHPELHAAFEVTAGHAHEGDAVAVRRVHVGLNLEHHTGEFGFFGVHHSLDGGAVAWGRRQVHQRVQHLAHAEVVDRRAEQHGRLFARQKLCFVERGRSAFDQFQLVLGLLKFTAESLQALGVVQAGQHVFIATTAVFARSEHAHLVGATVVHAAESLAHAHGPGEGHHGHAKFALDLVHQVQRGLHLAVHLVNEGEDGRVACAADLQQAPRLRLHAIAGVDHHQRGVHGGQHAVGVFREVLVARGVEQVDHAVAVFHLHHGRRHGDAALLFDLHPVGRGVARGLARLHRASDVDGAREQQQLLGQGRFTRVGVGDDGEGAATLHLLGNFGHSP